MKLDIDLQQAIYALADALDLVGVDEVAHGKRVAFMANACGYLLNLGEEDEIRLFHSALLHDCGVSSTRVHRHLVEEMEWDYVEDHCQVGKDLLGSVPPLRGLADIVRYHHTNWTELPEAGISDQDALFANLIFLVDRVDSLAAAHYGKDILHARHGIREQIESMAGTLFSRELVDLFLQASDSEAFWLTMEPSHLTRFLTELQYERPPIYISFSDMKKLGLMFAHVVDAKSRFTAEHSLGVARLASHIGNAMALSEETCQKIELAGLLHDLGKLKIPDELLEKPGALDGLDRSQMLQHSFESYQILRRIRGLEEIALWAAYHHETLEGRGYPFHANGDQISREARIIAVADIFQALAQDRPYREALPIDEIMAILSEKAGFNHIDQDIVDVIARDPELCWQKATGI